MPRRGTLLAYVRAEVSVAAPLVPASWDRTLEDNRWCTIYPAGRDNFFQARLTARNLTLLQRAFFVCVGPPVMLQHLADAIAGDALPWTQTWADLPTFRADLLPLATAIRAEWPDERHPASPGGLLVRLHARLAGFQDDDAEGGPTWPTW